MKIPPPYTITPEIVKLITQIEASRLFLTNLNIPVPILEKIKRVSLLKSSLFSARIEGNPLTFNDVQNIGKSDKKQEIFNIVDAVNLLDKVILKDQIIDDKNIFQLHRKVMNGIRSDAGCFRKEPGAIFNQAGVAVYFSPPPQKIKQLLGNLLNYINKGEEQFPLVCAFISHLVFEKIHPFTDGNGRVGRLLIYAILKSRGYDFKLCIPFEEYLDDHKSEYYYHLDRGMINTDEFLNFMLNAFLEQIEKIKEEVAIQMQKKDDIFLPPRQEEILMIIKEHDIVSFDFLHRRFFGVPQRTLRYDLKKLQNLGLVIKIGKTRGVFYRLSR